MQKLHLIGFTTDLDGLIFSARRGTRSGGFTVEIDDDLIRTIEEVMRLRANGEDEEVEEGQEEHPTGAWRVTVPQPESVLTPREIQARLRTGATLAEVAEEAGVDEEWVARFAPPVWAEQSRIIATAQRLVLEKPRVGVSAEPLGDSVRTNLAERGTIVDDESFDSAWGAYHVTASTWVVTFDPPGKGRRQVAMWQLDTAAETLTSANRAASDLGYATAKGRRRNRAQEGANEEALARVARTATKKSEAVRQQAAKKTAKKTAKRAAKKPAGGAGTARKAPTRVAPRKATPRKVAAKKPAVKKSSAKKTAAAKKTKAPPTPRVTVAAVPPPAPPRAPAPLPAPVLAREPRPEPRPETRPEQRPEPQPDAAAIAAREERRRLRDERRAAAMAAVAREEPAPAPAPPVRSAPPVPPVIAAAVAADEASGRVVRIHANRAAPAAVPAEAAGSPRRTRGAERRRRRMFRGD